MNPPGSRYQIYVLIPVDPRLETGEREEVNKSFLDRLFPKTQDLRTQALIDWVPDCLIDSVLHSCGIRYNVQRVESEATVLNKMLGLNLLPLFKEVLWKLPGMVTPAFD